MAECNCPCTCPLEVGDEIRFKLIEGDSGVKARYAGALKLTLAYLGEEHVIYTWETRTSPALSHGEGYLSRSDFNRRVEKAPKGWTGD